LRLTINHVEVWDPSWDGATASPLEAIVDPQGAEVDDPQGAEVDDPKGTEVTDPAVGTAAFN
jgi:hypothetical protein